MSVLSKNINSNYGNFGNIHNPVFEDAISILIDRGLLTNDLDPNTSIARTFVDPNTKIPNNIQNYKNAEGQPSKAIGVEVMVDAILKAILLGYKNGFKQGIVEKDAATNINFKTQALLEDPILLTLNLNQTKNVHEAIVLLALEINQIKAGLTSLGVNIPNSVVIPSTANELTLD